MKVGRRGFLGLLAGGVAGGPKLAQGLAEQAVQYGGEVAGPSAGYANVIGGKVDWESHRIGQLRKWLSGEEVSEDEQWRRQRVWQQLDQRDRYRIDALRSVSMVHKHRMFHYGEDSRQRVRSRQQWEHELSQLTGGLL